MLEGDGEEAAWVAAAEEAGVEGVADEDSEEATGKIVPVGLPIGRAVSSAVLRSDEPMERV